MILGENDVVDVEESWGYSLVEYFVSRFPRKTALLQLCDLQNLKYKYFVHSSRWLILKFKIDARG